MPLIKCPDCDSDISDAAPACIHCGRPSPSVEAAVTDVQPSAAGGDDPSLFYAMTPTKLAILSFFTLGMYEYYWFYRNWRGINEKTGRKVIPVLRALFAPLFAYSLFKSVRGNVKEPGVTVTWSAGLLAILYFGLTVSWQLPAAWWLISTLTFLPLVPVQQTINEAAQLERARGVVDDSYGAGAMIAIVIGGLILFLALLGMFAPAQA